MQTFFVKCSASTTRDITSFEKYLVKLGHIVPKEEDPHRLTQTDSTFKNAGFSYYNQIIAVSVEDL